MSILSLMLVLVIIGVLVWAVTTYLPMDNGIKNLIRIVGVVICLFYVLTAFGVIGSLSGVKVPQVK